MQSPVALWINRCGLMPHTEPVVQSCDFSIALPAVPHGSNTSATTSLGGADDQGVIQRVPCSLPYRITVVLFGTGAAPALREALLFFGGCGHHTVSVAEEATSAVPGVGVVLRGKRPC